MARFYGRAYQAFTLMLCIGTAIADTQNIIIEKEIDDNHIIITTEKGEQLLLEKWTLRLSPIVFEGKTFLAEISPMWVTIHFENRDPIKWSIEKTLGAGQAPPGRSKQSIQEQQTTTNSCYKTFIQEPSPFNGNGGELILLADGSVWKQVSYQYLYLYKYMPLVVICPFDNKMILGKHVFQLVRVK